MKNIIFIIFSTPLLYANTMSLDNFINEFRRNDIHQEKILNELMQLRYNKELNLPAREWLFEINTVSGKELRGGIDTSSQSATLTRNNEETGTQINLSYNKNDQIGRTEETKSFEIEQSLIRNSFGTQFRSREDSLEQENKILRLEVIETYEDYLSERINQYLNFVQLHNQLAIAKENVSLSTKLLNDIKKRKNRSIAKQVDLDRALIQNLKQKQELLNVKRDLNSTKENLKSSLTEDAFDNEKLLPSKNVPYINESIDFQKTLSAFYENGRTLQIIEANYQGAKDQVTIQKRNLYPEAKLILGFNEDISQRFGSNANRQEAVVGLSLSYAFGNGQTEALLNESKFRKIQATYEKKKVKRNIKNELKSLYLQIEKEREKLKLLSIEVRTANRLLKGEKNNFERGNINLRDLIDAQNILTSSKLNFISQKIILSKAIVSWKRLSDTLYKY